MLLRQDLQQADHGGITHRDGLGRTQLATPHQTTHYCAVRWEKRKQVLERPSRRRTARLAVGVLIQSKGANQAGGDRDGEKFTVLGWEKRFIMGAFSKNGDSALSVGRGNGKSALVAGLATACVDPSGPLTGPRREVLCVASSFGQSRIIFEDVFVVFAWRWP